MATATKITRVTASWDDGEYDTSTGWLCRSYSGSDLVEDSTHIQWPIDVQEFGRDDADELEEALRDAFPGAEIEVED